MSGKGITTVVKRYALLLLLTAFKLCTTHTSVSDDITITYNPTHKSVFGRYNADIVHCLLCLIPNISYVPVPLLLFQFRFIESL